MTQQRIRTISKVTLNRLASGYRSSNALNSDFQFIEEAFDNTLSRDGSGPNHMLAPFDMNGFKILNVAPPTEATDVVRLQDLNELANPFKIGIDVRYFGAKFDGVTDDSVAIQNAVNFAALVGDLVRLPKGVAYLTKTIFVPSSVGLQGQGRTVTQLRKTGVYGPMIQFGTAASPYQGAYVGDFWAYHDYGDGAFPPNSVPVGGIKNPSGTEDILDFHGPYNSEVNNVWVCGGGNQIRIRGGAQSSIINCATNGVYYPGVSALQFSTSGFRIDKGSSGQLPTNLAMVGCSFGGTITPGNVSITWPANGGGPNITTNVGRNIGPLRVVEITCAEAISFIGCYFGSGSKHNISLNNVDTGSGNILSGVSFTDCFMDAAHEEMVAFEGNNATTSIQLHMREWVGQNNCYGAITDKNATSPSYNASGVNIRGLMRAFIGPVINFTNSRQVTIDSDIGWYNTANFYTANPQYSCAVNVGSLCQNFEIRGMFGGDNGGLVDAKTTTGVNIVVGATKISTRGVIDGGVPVGNYLVTGGFLNNAIRVEDADFTLTQRVDACNVEHLGTLTGNRTITLSAVGAVDGDTWHIARVGGGAFTLSVAGADTKALSTGQWVTYRYNKAANRIARVAFGNL